MSASRFLTFVLIASCFLDHDQFRIEVINEPLLNTLASGGATFDQLADYYVQAYNTVRGAETVISGNDDVTVVIHDAFQEVTNVSVFSNIVDEHLAKQMAFSFDNSGTTFSPTR